MAGNLCTIRVRLTRRLFRRLAAKAIEDRTDLNTVILRAVESEIPPCRPAASRRPPPRAG